MKALISVSVLACLMVGGLQAHNLVVQDPDDPNDPGQERSWIFDETEDPNDPGQERSWISDETEDPNDPGQERGLVAEDPNDPEGGE